MTRWLEQNLGCMALSKDGDGWPSGRHRGCTTWSGRILMRLQRRWIFPLLVSADMFKQHPFPRCVYDLGSEGL